MWYMKYIFLQFTLSITKPFFVIFLLNKKLWLLTLKILISENNFTKKYVFSFTSVCRILKNHFFFKKNVSFICDILLRPELEFRLKKSWNIWQMLDNFLHQNSSLGRNKMSQRCCAILLRIRGFLYYKSIKLKILTFLDELLQKILLFNLKRLSFLFK